MITSEEVALALPTNLKSVATQEIADYINNISGDPLIAEQIRNNFVSYASVMKEGKHSTKQYMEAVTYATFKLMNYTNNEAYARTFPQRYQSMVANGKTPKEISSFVHAYNKGKLVNQIMEQTLVPMWVLNQPYFQEAILTQVDLMRNSGSDKVRSDAANSLLTHLAKPKDTAPLVQIDMRDTGLNAMKEQILLLAQAQRGAIENGTTARDIAATPLFPKESEVIENGAD